MRGRTALVAGTVLLLVAAGVAATSWFLWDAGSAVESDEPEDAAPGSSEIKRDARPAPIRRRRPRPTAEAPDPDADVKAAWDAALALHKAGKPIEALTGLVSWRKSRAPWFATPPRPALLAEMERAALALLARAARTASLEEAARLAALLKDLIGDPSLLTEVDDLLAAAKRRAAAADLAVGADVIGKADLLADKQALSRHLQRFADRGPAPKKPDWIDTQLAAVAATNAALEKEPDPLGIPDPAEAESRRLDQLDKLRERNAVGLLDHIDGSLAWLALHQADDGHFGADATVARCKTLKHEPACAGSANEQYPLAATGLCVLAFLDFRDQDVKRLFEPTLARATKWLLAQQQPDGSFKPQATPGWAKGYAWAIGLMALGQTAASTGDPEVKAAVQRGIGFFAKHAGKNGGYRYGLDQEGDLSVTGWFVQAVEAAKSAGVAAPDDMTKGLDRFLSTVSLGPPAHAFCYGQSGGTWDGFKVNPPISPIGMLSMSILRPQSPQWYGDEWRDFIAKSRNFSEYWLYYAVRVSLFLDGKVSDKMRGFLNELAAKQKVAGGAAGMVPLEGGRLNGQGATLQTAFATLTMEHALYRR